MPKFDYSHPALHTALAVYRDAESSRKLQRASPLRFSTETVGQRAKAVDFRVEPPTPGQKTNSSGAGGDGFPLTWSQGHTGIEEMIRVEDFTMSGTGTASSNSSTGGSLPPPIIPATKSFEGASMPIPTKAQQESRPVLREFEINAKDSLSQLQDLAERRYYYGPFQVEKTPVQEDLANLVPLFGLSEVSLRRQTADPALVWRRKTMDKERISLAQLWTAGRGKRWRAGENKGQMLKVNMNATYERQWAARHRFEKWAHEGGFRDGKRSRGTS